MNRVIIYPDAALTARAAGLRLIQALIEAQSLRSPNHVALTGGTLGIQMLSTIRDEPLLDAVDWSEVHFWWGDERFADDEDRNASQARGALLDSLPIPVENLHEVARPSAGVSLDQAAEIYADAVRDVHFTVMILGIGPDGHLASLFPDRPEIDVDGRGALAIRNSPKPPPERVTLTRDSLQACDELWFIAAGEDKAEAIAAAYQGADIPAGKVRGPHTLWFLDTAVAAGI
ncbi:MAG: 6-phosphogluconolactonase [Ruaniaceae bacterium]|nr:6-phosphogluconolactonase [Ruaniaceae bacterium]